MMNELGFGVEEEEVVLRSDSVTSLSENEMKFSIEKVKLD